MMLNIKTLREILEQKAVKDIFLGKDKDGNNIMKTMITIEDVQDLFSVFQQQIQKLKPKLTTVTLTGSYYEGYLDALYDVLRLIEASGDKK